MSEENFNELFEKAVSTQGLKSWEVAQRARCLTEIVRYYRSGKRIPINQQSLGRFQFLFPNQTDWNNIQNTWKRQDERKRQETYHPYGSEGLQGEGKVTCGKESGEFIRDLRIRYRVPQRAAQNATGIAQTYWGQIKSGNFLLSPEAILKICASEICKTEQDKQRLKEAYKADLQHATKFTFG